MSAGIQPVDQDAVLDSDPNSEPNQDLDKDPESELDSFWLELATSNFVTARAYQDSSLITQWERNADHFNSNHYRRSAYNSKLYSGRSKLFRPLTRASERSASAKAAAAFFSNLELVNVDPENQNDPEQMMAARVMRNVLHYRLDKSIPWFLTVMGAYQDTRVYGPCCTYAHWEFKEETIEIEEPEIDLQGTEIEGRTKTITKKFVTRDQPVIDMIPVENLLLDAACDWRDPIGTSPYIVRLVPMYVVDVEARMEAVDSKTNEPEWLPLSRGQILSASKDTYNTVRQAREGEQREDSTNTQQRDEFKVVWAHENFVRLQGQEYVFWTLGTQYMLSTPKLLADAYTAGVRPMSYGFSVIEAHRFAPSSATDLIANIQAGVNDIANLRIDNVRLALNKRYVIRRGAVIDLEALMRSVPGGGVLTENIETDIKVIDTKDVTASSYKEQERLETEANDISGTFLGGNMRQEGNQQQLVGTAKISQEATASISEMDLMTFATTWMKSQLTHLMQLIQANEIDDVIFHTAFDEASKKFKFMEGIGDSEPEEDVRNRIRLKFLQDKLTLKLSLGLAATSPERKSAAIANTVGIIAQNPDQAARINWDEVSKEQFAAAGFQDGERFLKSEDKDAQPRITEEDLQAAKEQGAQEAGMQMKQADIESRERMASQERDLKAWIAELNANKDMIIHQQGLTMKEKLDHMKAISNERMTALREGNKANEIALKDKIGSGTTGTGV